LAFSGSSQLRCAVLPAAGGILEETTYKNPEVVRLTEESFVPPKVDADVHETFIDRHWIDAFPTILFLDARGREIGRRPSIAWGSSTRGKMPPFVARMVRA
jgi:hypothetical protein